MSDRRISGLVLMGLSIACFLGTTTEALPPATFFPALAVFALGAIKFMKANSLELQKAERRTERRVNPTIRENRHAHAHAERLAAKRGGSLNALNPNDDVDPETAARMAPGQMPSERALIGDAIDIGDADDDLVVATDVSFPVEVQSGDALADQLSKLNTLMAQGVLTEEEYAVAKAKLLG